MDEVWENQTSSIDNFWLVRNCTSRLFSLERRGIISQVRLNNALIFGSWHAYTKEKLHNVCPFVKWCDDLHYIHCIRATSYCRDLFGLYIHYNIKEELIFYPYPAYICWNKMWIWIQWFQNMYSLIDDLIL